MTPELIPPVVDYVAQCLNHAVGLIYFKIIMIVHSFAGKILDVLLNFFLI
jgi:AP-4 complex subunit epsilon-1